MSENLIGRPTLSGVMVESADYTNMGVGLTNRLFLLGHGDGIPLNDYYQVNSMRDTVRKLGGNTDVPLLRSLLEVYYSGARDIWIIPVAPFDEYVEDLDQRLVPNDAWGGKNFYEQYYDRLTVAYDLLQGLEIPQIIVPLHAPFYGAGDVDFLTQLATHCQNAFDLTGTIQIGIIGTAVRTITQATVDAIAGDSRLADFGPEGKFVLPVVGSGLYNIQEIVQTHEGPVSTAVAAELSQLALDRGLTYKRLRQIITLSHADLTPAQIETLCNARLNPVVRNARSKRGSAFETMLASDNTLGAFDSDYWSLTQVRLVMTVIDRLRGMGKRYLGTVGFSQFKSEVNEYLFDLAIGNVIRSFDVQFERAMDEETFRFSETVNVEVTLQPYFGVRTLSFSAEVGPGI
jgi:hypothetical protein